MISMQFPLDGRLATYFDPKPWRGPPRTTVTIGDRAEWERVIANVRPSQIHVSGDREWFRNGFGAVYQILIGDPS